MDKQVGMEEKMAKPEVCYRVTYQAIVQVPIYVDTEDADEALRTAQGIVKVGPWRDEIDIGSADILGNEPTVEVEVEDTS